jgi:hypothetical protein
LPDYHEDQAPPAEEWVRLPTLVRTSWP